MQHWTKLQRNQRATGHFAGRSQADQDAYFEAFEGGDTLRTLRQFEAAAQARLRGMAPWIKAKATGLREWAKLAPLR